LTSSGPRDGDGRIQELAQLSQVAHMYYNLNMLQPEIAEKLFFSRSKVSRMLDKARKLGIVEVKIKRIFDRASSVEENLKARFGLKEAIVVTTYDENKDELFDAITDFASVYVSNLIKGDCTVGITRGNTIIKLVNKLVKLNECNIQVVQLMGAAGGRDTSAESRELVNKVSQIYSGAGHYLNVPLYVDDLYAKDILLQDPIVQKTFQVMKQCDIVLTGLGGFNPDAAGAGEPVPNWFEYLVEKHIVELREKGAVGSICAQFFDVNGNRVDCEWNEKCIGMPFEQIKNSLTVGVVSGPEKTLPLLGALRGRLLDVVITDINTVLKVLETGKVFATGLEKTDSL
jgi:DNA-binding transcriptional regulator LsrR (DeoR family)